MEQLRQFAMSVLQFPCDAGWMVTLHMSLGGDQVTHCKHALATTPAAALHQALDDAPAFALALAALRRGLADVIPASQQHLRSFSFVMGADPEQPDGWRAQIDVGESRRSVRVATHAELSGAVREVFRRAAEMDLHAGAVACMVVEGTAEPRPAQRDRSGVA